MISNESDSPANQNLACSTSGVGASKAKYWRSINQLRGEAEINEYLDREFPVAASEFPEGVSRRRWMQLMGASLAIAGAAGCRYPKETIEPFVIRPEGRVPGESYQRATNFELAGRVYNLLVTCVDGRPLKVEPNATHPGGSGTDAYSQASVLQLYDPDRGRGDDGFLLRKSAAVEDRGRRFEVDWSEFDPVGKAIVDSAGDGSGFALLMSPTSSPSLVGKVRALKKRLPKATVCQYDGVVGNAMAKATKAVFGKASRQTLELADADVIVALQADILGSDAAMLNNVAGFSKRRDPSPDAAHKMNRLYVVEGGFTATGAAADSRLPLRPSQIPLFLAELGRRVKALSAGEVQEYAAADGELPFDDKNLPSEDRLGRFLDVLAQDIFEAGDKAVVVVGDHLGAEAIEAGIRMNQALGSYGKLQSFSARPDDGLDTGVSLAGLVDSINAGSIKDLLILGDNPVYTAPGNVDLGTAVSKLTSEGSTVYLGEYDDETGELCQWSLPLSHQLESWGDCVNDRGYYGVCQPQILPLLGGRSAIELLAVMLGETVVDGGEIVRRTSNDIGQSGLSDREWRGLLHDGFKEGLVFDGGVLELSVALDADVSIDESPDATATVDKNNIEVIFSPADGLYDGRFANNGWLQEMPQQLTKLAWDNAAVMSPRTAKSLSLDGDATDGTENSGRELRHGQMVALRIDGEKVVLPVYEMPGCAPGVVTVTLGYGRERVGMVGGDVDKGVALVGFGVSAIRRGEDVLVAYGVEGRPRYTEYELSTTQDHWAIDERGKDETELRSFTLVREGTTQLYEKIPEFAESMGPHVPHVGENGSPWEEPLTQYMEEDSKVPQWGMTIDLNKCIGCNGCVVACQAENNVPIVGREQVMNSREMHWLRVDRYFQVPGDGDDEDNDMAQVVHQPVSCQHCETAPCEQVCPVAATVHTEEGINAMAYNRCIGTRYCANNCPFKVRRFNYFNYNEDIGTGYGIDAFPGNIEDANRKLQALVMNPEVTVRGRGVMEKCTYCIQSIEKAKITAIKEHRELRDGDVSTACQSACPANCIEFGNIADPDSRVSKSRKSPRNYELLSQLNLHTRTKYLARVSNPNPRLMTSRQIADLANLKAPHHGLHGDHSGSDHHEGGHGDDHGQHGHSGHEHEEKNSESVSH